MAITFALSSLEERKDLSYSQKDSLYFFMAMAYDQQKKDSISEIYFLKVSDSSSLYMRSNFLVAQKCIKRNDFKKANGILSNLPLTDNENTNEFKYFLEQGTALIIGKPTPLGNEDRKLKLTKPNLQKEMAQLEFLSREKSKLKKKSPWIAGALSAIVPGLGKVYAGSNAQGLATFIRVTLLAGLATENYLRHGIKNPQFWFFGGLASAYYVGGIYGSVYLPKLNYQEKIDAIHQDAKVGLLSAY